MPQLLLVPDPSLNIPDLLVSTSMDGKEYTKDTQYNVPKQILDHVGRNLYLQSDHPLCLTRELVESAFPSDQGFNNRHEPHPVVTTKENFDDLGFPTDHPGRSKTDTYYVNQDHVLRTHTSAHELKLFSELQTELPSGSHGYTLCSDVFRRDSIDRSHYPVFHQMEGARCWRLVTADQVLSPEERTSRVGTERQRCLQAIEQDLKQLPMWQHRNGVPVASHLLQQAALDLKTEDPNPTFDLETNPLQASHNSPEVELVASHMKLSIEFLIAKVFRQAQNAGIISRSESPRVRWVPAYFPFTSPSWELEVWWQGEWLELLGCGISKQQLLVGAGIPESIGWAWGIGIERLAMLLYGIPDIRLFWSKDQRFLSQFGAGKATMFREFSKYPECYKDIAFWLPEPEQGEKAAVAPNAGVETPVEIAVPSGAAASAGGHMAAEEPIFHSSFHENDLAEIVRDVAGPLVENVVLVDEFFSEKKKRKSLCYRITYRSLERTLTNEEVNDLHEKIRQKMEGQLRVELR
ncbi:MAG: hypothetical protein Q9160_003346 [Pyrenula sp. 1 TL-2023]